ncbi:MAG: hypothetical protein ABI155_11660 [Paralcaligenes sp.]
MKIPDRPIFSPRRATNEPANSCPILFIELVEPEVHDVLAMHKTLDSVAQARDDFEIFTYLAERGDYSDLFTEGHDEMGCVKSI